MEDHPRFHYLLVSKIYPDCFTKNSDSGLKPRLAQTPLRRNF